MYMRVCARPSVAAMERIHLDRAIPRRRVRPAPCRGAGVRDPRATFFETG